MRKALTVGELLVAMTIIGVIAMLVLPGFLKDYHKKIYTTRLKRVYEMLSEAVERSCVDSNVSYFQQTRYSMSDKNAQQEFLDKYFKKASLDKSFPFADQYGKINNSETGSLDQIKNYAYVKLASGEVLALSCAHDIAECIVAVDINSLDGPNIGGRDMFWFRIDAKNNTIMSHSAASDCGNDQYGNGCLNRLIQDNWVMNY